MPSMTEENQTGNVPTVEQTPWREKQPLVVATPLLNVKLVDGVLVTCPVRRNKMRDFVCKECGGTMIGDGYSLILHCENVDLWDGEHAFSAPDEGPVYCRKWPPFTHEEEG